MKYIIAFLFIILNNIAFAEVKADVKKIEDYLNNLQSISSDFIQVDENGVTSTGNFYMQKPGKFRMNYCSPNKVSVILSNGNIAYVDYELQQVSFSPASQNLASLITENNFSFNKNKNLIIKQITQTKNTIRLTLTRESKALEGDITFVFEDLPLRFKKFEITDQLGKTVTVSLSNIKYDQMIDKKIFAFPAKNIFKNANNGILKKQ